MDLLMLLESLACHSHHQSGISDLLKNQPNKIQNAFLNNDTDFIKMQFSNQEGIANKTTVFTV